MNSIYVRIGFHNYHGIQFSRQIDFLDSFIWITLLCANQACRRYNFTQQLYNLQQHNSHSWYSNTTQQHNFSCTICTTRELAGLKIQLVNTILSKQLVWKRQIQTTLSKFVENIQVKTHYVVNFIVFFCCQSAWNSNRRKSTILWKKPDILIHK